MPDDGWTTLPFDQAVLVNPSVRLERGEVYPFVDMQAVAPGSRSVAPSEERTFKGGGSRFVHGDTLMARITPCLENGKIARYAAPEGEGTGHGSTEFIVIRGRPNVTDNGFAFYLTKWDGVRQYCISQMTGSSGRQRVPTGALSHREVTIPPLKEQEAIACILGALDDKIELNRTMNQTLEATAQAIFKSWFVDFDPVRAKAAGQIPAGMKPEIAALFPDSLEESELGDIPTGWKPATLGSIAENVRSGVQPGEIERGTPYIGLEHMPRRSIALSEWGFADEVVSNKFKFKSGDILFGKLRPYFHKVGVAPTDGVCSTDILVIAPQSPQWFDLVLFHVSSLEFINHTNAGSTGTKMPRTNWNEMQRYGLVLPPEDLANAFGERIHPMAERILAGIHESQTLSAIRDALLPKLISGELTIPDVERIVGRAI